ncbi:hypothetical protein [Fictibacillus norfolkensis]|jgi:Family of unknown function (UPF0738)|uniref:Uncharacterized protein n=1 Tax=Fictibacillus norfolkensis TaxID=2762233 RepID=A0ABR8SQF8_9BACL|nr:hypothetical protein [Fictibacillus norfolkensis]MBD7965599.1 hypothetical protein [Fictibacillus norfolkensis]
MMPRRLNVQSTAWKDNKLILLIENEENTGISDWKDSERMLVDSDGLAFIYVLEDEDGFIYISIDHNHWNEVKSALQKDAVFAVQNDKREELELTAFSREMDFLTDNIQGNANYGQQMEDEVIKIFGTEEKAQ